MAEDTDIQEPPVAEDEQQSPPPEQGPGPKQVPLKDPDKQKLVQIITKMQSAGESEDNIRAVVKRFQESAIAKPTTPIDAGIQKTTDKVNQPIQPNGTFEPDLEGEKKGFYIDDPDYQRQRTDFDSKTLKDAKGNYMYPVPDEKGNFSNYYTKEPIIDFNPHEMSGKVLRVPHEYLAATGGRKYITPIYNQRTNSYDFPGVEKPQPSPIETLPEATVYGTKKGTLSAEPAMSGPTSLIAEESKKQGGQFDQVLKGHPELDQQIKETLWKYGPEYTKSILTGSGAMANVLQKTVEDHYDLDKPLPSNVDPEVLNGHLNVRNNFEKNRQEFEQTSQELQHQADLIADRSKRTGQPIVQDDMDRLKQKALSNIQKWNDYVKSVKYSQNYLDQPEVKDFLSGVQKRQKGQELLDEINQRSFPNEVNNQIKKDEFDAPAVLAAHKVGNIGAGEYALRILKTFGGKAGSALMNIGETAAKAQTGGNPLTNISIEGLNNSAQEYIKSNLPELSRKAREQIDKGTDNESSIISLFANDLSSTMGSIAPYAIPGMAGEGLGAKAATFATSLAEGLPEARREALNQGLTGDAYNTYVVAKPLVTAAFMTLLPNVKFAKGFENDVAKSVVNGEFNNPLRAMGKLATKIITPHPGNIAHIQAMLSGTALGQALVNKVTNTLQAKDDIDRGINRKEGLSTDLSGVFDPRQTAIMALTGKLLEAIPTLKNAVGDRVKGKEIQETYNHIQNNMVELAANNLQGASDQVEKLVKKDPGNIYAQHLKNTLQDFAYAKARMPEGLEPEQEAALFDIQKQISQKQRQSSYADPVYQPHLQKNIEELNKQIPEIINNPKKANDYLKDAHTDLTESILSPKTENNERAETDQNGQAEGREGQITEPTGGGETNSMKDDKAPSFLESRHADTVDDEKGIVSGPNDKPISSEGKKDANDLAKEVEDKGVTKVITSDLERARQTGRIVAEKTGATIEHRPELNTWDIGDFDKSKDSEFKKAQDFFVKNPDATEFEGKKINETFNQYKDRIIKARTALENEPASTLVVNHSNNMMLWDAFVKNGHEWNEKAENDYLSAKTPEPATLTNKTSGFKTEKGSFYDIDEKGATARNKAAREGHTDSGPQEKSQKTYYITPEDVNTLSEIQTTGGDKKIIAESNDGKIGVKYITGPNTGKFERRTMVSPHDKPEIGLHPLEIWKNGEEHHFGNKIIKLSTNKTKENAISEQSPNEVGKQSIGDRGAGGNGESSGVEPSVERPESPGESGIGQQTDKKENKSQEKDDESPFIEEEGDNDFTSTKNAITEQKVSESGLLPAMNEAKREFGEVWDQAQKKLKKGFDIEKLIKDLGKKPRAVTDLENAMILYHQNVKESQLAEASKDLDQARKDGNRQEWNDAYDRHQKLLDDLQDIYNVDKAIGRETARGLNARKMMVDRRFSLVNMQLEKRASAGGEPLTEKQTEEVKSQYEEIKKTKDAYEARIEELQKEYARLTAEKAIAKEKSKSGRPKKTKAEFSKERKDIVQRMRDDLLKAAKGGEGLTSSIPLAAQLKAIAPHMRDLVKSFIDQGIDRLEDITKGIHDLLKPSIPDLEERHIHDLIAGEFNAPKETTGEKSKYQQVKEESKVQKYRATDPKLMKLQADYERAKEKFNHSLQKDQLKTRTGFQKIQDSFLKYERFAKLSNPITLGKLAMASITRIATTPIEETVGAVYSAGLPGIAKKAPGEAGFHVRALAKGYKAAFMRGLDDAATVAKGGSTDIEAVYGKHGHPPPEAIDFFGQLHSAIKAPVKRFAFERSFEKRMANNIKNGTPIDGMVEARIAMEAYKDAQRSIFMQDNPVARGWSNAMRAMEQSGDTGKVVATIGQWLIPFVKVPTNILGETVSHVIGPEIALGKIIATSLGKGLENLSQDEAESIMRNLKKGTIGHVALMAGYLNPKIFGGYYQKDDKRKPGDVKPGDMKILGHTIPAWALEAPLFQAMQLGATVRRIKDTQVKGQEKGIGEGIWGGALGLMSHEPLIDEPSRLGGMMASPKERQYFMGELAKSTLVPAVSDYAAKVSDPLDTHSIARKIIEPENNRKPESIKEHIESAIPGLRESVGQKPPPGAHKQRQHKPSS